MEVIRVDGQEFELVANTIVHPWMWVIQVAPEYQAFFESIKGVTKTFEHNIDGGATLKGAVTRIEPHNYNQGKPQVQVEISQ